jgi:hypothetical protein
MVIAPDGSEAAGVHFVWENQPNPKSVPLYCRGLEGEKLYRITSRSTRPHIMDFGSLANYMSPIRIRSGSLVEKAADRLVKLPQDELELTASGTAFCHRGFYPIQPFGGTGFNGATRLMRDFDSRLYLWAEEKE